MRNSGPLTPRVPSITGNVYTWFVEIIYFKKKRRKRETGNGVLEIFTMRLTIFFFLFYKYIRTTGNGLHVK